LSTGGNYYESHSRLWPAKRNSAERAAAAPFIYLTKLNEIENMTIRCFPSLAKRDNRKDVSAAFALSVSAVLTKQK
jgi:hypothetical protein